MAREQRKDVDYFPHDCTHGRKMHIIEQKYGNDGYATWFKLLEQLGKANNHYIDISDEMTFFFLVSTFRVSEEMTRNILNDLAKIGAIDKFLFENHNVIWSQKFTESVADAYRKRKTKIFQYSDVLKEIGVDLGQSSAGLPEVIHKEYVNPPEVIPKEEKSKEEKRKEEEILKSNFDNSKNIEYALVQKTESPTWIETTAMQFKISPEVIPKKLDEFVLYLGNIEKKHPTKKDFLTHFNNWLKNNIHANPTTNHDRKQNTSSGYKPAEVNTGELVRELTEDVENGNIPGVYTG